MKIFPNLIGYKCGYLTVIDKGHSTRGALYWKCKCKCGKIKYYTRQTIMKGTLRSCGCFKATCRGIHHKNWRGCGKVSSALFSKIRTLAKRRHLNFDLTIDYLWQLFEQQNGKCPLSGGGLTLPMTAYEIGHGKGSASLDRIDSSLGYIRGNVQWLLKDINMMKQQFPQSHFIEMCHLVSKTNA